MTKIYILLFSFLSLNVLSQNTSNFNEGLGILTGEIIDSTSNTPIEYVQIKMYSQKDSVIVTGIYSDSNGRFNLDKIPFDSYYIKITFIGYQTITIPNVVF